MVANRSATSEWRPTGRNIVNPTNHPLYSGDTVSVQPIGFASNAEPFRAVVVQDAPRGSRVVHVRQLLTTGRMSKYTFQLPRDRMSRVQS
jgi:hypothetical protein